jgi:hypothetical protein
MGRGANLNDESEMMSGKKPNKTFSWKEIKESDNLIVISGRVYNVQHFKVKIENYLLYITINDF